jgi:uncharacterized integral membrane protein
MWIIKYALAAAVLLVVMYFSFLNAQEITTVTLWSGYMIPDIRLIMVIYASFAMGVIFWFFVSIFQYFKVTSQVADLKKKNKQLTEEIKALRNLPIEEVKPQDMNSGKQENG